MIDPSNVTNGSSRHPSGGMHTDHARVWARGMTITDPARKRNAAVLRAAFQNPRTTPSSQQDLGRDLGDYDRAFGLEVI